MPRGGRCGLARGSGPMVFEAVTSASSARRLRREASRAAPAHCNELSKALQGTPEGRRHRHGNNDICWPPPPAQGPISTRLSALTEH
eukprot:2507231-Pyramimonas_sp.AAC.1